MNLVRRIYLYVMSAVALGVLLYGLQELLTVVLNALGLRGGDLIGGSLDDRRALSLAIALVGVGLPVWAVHWFLIERGLRGANADEERDSGLRAFFLSAVLAVLLLIASIVAIDLLRDLGLRLLPATGEYNPYGGGIADRLSILLVTSVGWAFHAWTRRRDASAGTLTGPAAWWPRLYRYIAAFIALAIVASGVASLLRLVLSYVTGADPEFYAPVASNRYAFALVDMLPPAIVALAIWASHAWATERVAGGSGWQGMSERASRARLVYWPAVVAIAGAATLMSAAGALNVIITYVLVRPDGGSFGSNVSLAELIARSLLSAAPWLAVWWLHRRWRASADAASGDPDRPRLGDRLERHATSGVGLAFAAIASGWILGLLVDVAFGGNRTVGMGWQYELARYLSWAILGLPLWLWNWMRLQALRASDPVLEASSTVRRAYLLLAVGVAIISTLGSLAIVLYRLVGFILGAVLQGNPVSELSTPLGALIIAAAIVVYHGLQLRTDRDVRPEPVPPFAAAPTVTAPGDAVPVVAADGAAVRELALRVTLPAGADAASALAQLRSALPEGATLEEA